MATIGPNDATTLMNLLAGRTMVDDDIGDRPATENDHQDGRIEDDEGIFMEVENWEKAIDQFEDGVRTRPMMLEANHEAEHVGGGSILAAHWGD